METSRDFEEFFACLNAHNVRYVIVGAYAFAMHARPRYTGDLDVLILPTADNAELVLKALETFGLGGLAITQNDLTVPARVIQIGYPPSRIDLMTSIDGVDAERSWVERIEGRYGKERVWFLSKANLIANKKATGRPKDLEDLKDLE
jgi:hypothetical protein